MAHQEGNRHPCNRVAPPRYLGSSRTHHGISGRTTAFQNSRRERLSSSSCISSRCDPHRVLNTALAQLHMPLSSKFCRVSHVYWPTLRHQAAIRSQSCLQNTVFHIQNTGRKYRCAWRNRGVCLRRGYPLVYSAHPYQVVPFLLPKVPIFQLYGGTFLN